MYTFLKIILILYLFGLNIYGSSVKPLFTNKNMQIKISEIEKKYQIGVRRFGLINWVGAHNLYVKEVNRLFVVWAQTLLSPLISSLLFLFVNLNNSFNE